MNYRILVNKDNPYDKNDFSNFILVKGDEGVFLEKRTFRAYLDLKKRLEKDNIYIKVVSGYRTIDDQSKEREDYIETKKKLEEIENSKWWKIRNILKGEQKK